MCGVLFGLCSLTNLTALSLVCCLKVCFTNHGERLISQSDKHDLANRRLSSQRLMAAERNIHSPLKLPFLSPVLSGNRFSSSHACLLVVGVWCYALVFALGPLAQWGHYSAEPYGTACCIDWQAPNHELSALSYIVCLFLFCYALPCTIIFLSYTLILLTVRGSRQAVQKHVSPQTKTTKAHALIVKVRGCDSCFSWACTFSAVSLIVSWICLMMINTMINNQLIPVEFTLFHIMN